MFLSYFKQGPLKAIWIVLSILFAQTIFIPSSSAHFSTCSPYVLNRSMDVPESGSPKAYLPPIVPAEIEKNPHGVSDFFKNGHRAKVQWESSEYFARLSSDERAYFEAFRHDYDQGFFEVLDHPVYVAFEADKATIRLPGLQFPISGAQFGILKGYNDDRELMVDIWINGKFERVTLSSSELQSTRYSEFAESFLSPNPLQRPKWTQSADAQMIDGYIHNRFDSSNRFIRKKSTDSLYRILRLDFDGSLIIQGKNGGIVSIQRDSFEDFVVSSKSRKNFTGRHFVWDEIPKDHPRRKEFRKFRQMVEEMGSGYFKTESDRHWVMIESTGNPRLVHLRLSNLRETGEVVAFDIAFDYNDIKFFDGPYLLPPKDLQILRFETPKETIARKRIPSLVVEKHRIWLQEHGLGF